jgi:ferric-dicitrate binding protein FerR (iron transport regulator)
MDFKRLFRKQVEPTDDRSLSTALDIGADRLRKVNPETDRQWQFLRIAIAQITSEPVGISPRAKLRLRPAIAFGLLLTALAIGGIVVFWPARQQVTYATGKGQLSKIVLADSTEVTLNHTSELIVDRRPGEKERRVRLNGEAYFHVRPTGKPFIVATDVGNVRVLGTEFNVRIRESQLQVAVITGRVNVTGGPGMSSGVILSPGTMVTWDKGEFPGTPEKILFADYPGWTNQKLLFQRNNLRSVCNEIEARFDVSVRIENPELLQETITGALDSRSAETAVATLATLTGSKYRHEANSFALF